MGGKQDRPAVLLRKLPDQGQQLPHTLGVDAKGRLIHDDDLRIFKQHVGDAQSLLHTAGIGLRLPVCRIRHAHPGQKLLCPLPDGFLRKPVQPPGKIQVFPSGHIPVEAHVVRQIADAALDADGIPRTVLSGDRGEALRGLRKAQKHQRGRGLPGAVWSQEAENLAFFDGQIQLVHRRLLSVALRQPHCLNHCLTHTRHRLYRLPYFLKTAATAAIRARMMTTAATPHTVEVFTDTRN